MLSVKSNKNLIILIAALSFTILVGFFGINAIYSSQLNAVNQSKSDVVFSVEEGSTLQDVLESLKQENLIKSDFFAKWYAKGNAVDVKAGDYVVNDAMSTQEILAYISDASKAITNEILVTIPEGTWAKTIAKKMETFTNVTADELLTLWNDETFLNEMIDHYAFLDESILNSEYPVKLEGYLYPDTYFFYRETNARDITMRFLDQFDAHYQQYAADIAASKYSIHDLIKLASVIQFESGKVEDMAMISGVFENRMNIDMMLQASATVCYGMYEYDTIWDCESNPEFDSPYNTYLYTGLPIGAICNPGIDAILAALNPAQTDYMYFVSDVFNDGTVYYAVTYEEHLANVDKYLNQK